MPKLMSAPPFTPVEPSQKSCTAFASPIRTGGSKIRTRRAPANGLTRSMSTRDLISMASPDETAFEIGFENCWTSKLMTRSRRLVHATSSENGSQDRNSSAFISAKAQTDQIRSSSILPERGTGPYTAVKPLRVSPDGRLLLYEVKEGGERTGTFELLDIETRDVLPDVLLRGYLRGFAFSPDSKSFYYVHEPLTANRPHHRAAYHHVLGTSFDDDKEIFLAGEDPQLRLQIVPGTAQLGFLSASFRRQDTDGLLAVVNRRTPRSRADHPAGGVQIRTSVASRRTDPGDYRSGRSELSDCRSSSTARSGTGVRGCSAGERCDHPELGCRGREDLCFLRPQTQNRSRYLRPCRQTTRAACRLRRRNTVRLVGGFGDDGRTAL